MLFRILSLAISFALFCCNLAEAIEPEKISLKEAIARGLEKNNQIKSARFQADSAKSAAAAASLHYLPSISFEEAWTRSDVPVNTFMMKLNQGRFTNQDFDASRLNNPSAVGDFRTAFTVEMPIVIPEAWAGQRVARRGAEHQEAVSSQVREQISYRIFQFYLDVQRSHAALRVAGKALEEARESRRQAAVRTAAGLGLKSDELRAATHMSAMEQNMISASNNLAISRMRLAMMTGSEEGAEVEIGRASCRERV